MKKILAALGFLFSFSVLANEVPFPESQGFYGLRYQGVSDGTTTCAPYLSSSVNSTLDGLLIEELNSDVAHSSSILSYTEFILGEKLSLDGKKKEVTRFSGSLLIKEHFKKNFFGKFKEASGLNMNYSEADNMHEKDNIRLEKTAGVGIVIQCLYYRIK